MNPMTVWLALVCAILVAVGPVEAISGTVRLQRLLKADESLLEQGQKKPSAASITVANDALTRGLEYKLFNNPSWVAEASYSCQQWGGALASFVSTAEINQAKGLVPSGVCAWIGLGDSSVEGKFSWADGTPYAYSNWATGEPNGGSNANTVCITSDGRWADSADHPDQFLCVRLRGSLPTQPVRKIQYTYIADKLTRSNADARCKSRGMTLASVTSQTELAAMRSVIPLNAGWVWIGSSDAVKEGLWTWDDGAPWGFGNWLPTYPNGGTSENFAVAMADTLKWKDVSGNDAGPMVCSKATPVVRSLEFKFFANPSFFDDAEEQCENWGGTLASLVSPDEAAATKNLIPSDTVTWIGLSDRDVEGRWLYVDGSFATTPFNPWDANEPSNGASENFAAILNGKFQDSSDQPKPFLCSRPVATTTTLPLTAANFDRVGNMVFNTDGSVTVDANAIARSKVTYTRPISVEFIAKMENPAAPGCVVFQVFPQTNDAGTGYNFGFGTNLGFDVDTPFQYVPDYSDASARGQYHSYRVELHANGQNMYFVDGLQVMQFTDFTYSSGRIGFGPSCVKFSIKSINIIKPPVFNSGRRPEYKVFEDKVTFAEAQKRCVAWGGALASVASEGDFNILISSMPQTSSLYWIGASDAVQEGKWQWLDNSDWGDYTSWMAGEPNGAAKENALAVNPVEKAFSDFDETENLPFVCMRAQGAFASEFQYFTNTALHDDAENQCVNWGGHLASINSPLDNSMVNAAMAKAGTPDGKVAWLSGSDAAKEGTWLWQDGTTMAAYSNWAATEPSGSTNENFMGFVGGQSVWQALCDAERGFVCERNKDATYTILPFDTNTWTISGSTITVANGIAMDQASGDSNSRMETIQKFTRPFTVEFTVKQTDKSAGAECVVMQVFPQNQDRYSGYSFGFGLRAGDDKPNQARLGHALVPGAAKVSGVWDWRGMNGGMDYGVYRMDLLDNGLIRYYVNNVFVASSVDNSLTTGTISIGKSCRAWTLSQVAVTTYASPKVTL